MAADGAMVVFKKGAYVNGLFDIQPPACLKDCCCFPCITSPAINTKVGEPVPKIGAIAGAFCGCSLCLMVLYGTKLKGPLEPTPIAIVKAWCCGPCYAHQLSKEQTAAGAIGAVIGVPSQVEMK